MKRFLFGALLLFLVTSSAVFYYSTRSDLVTTSSESAKIITIPEQTTAIPLAEKIGQLFIVGHWAKTPVASTTALIKNHHLGGVVIMSAPEDPNEIRAWVNAWQAVSPLPLIIAIDQEGGLVSRLRGPAFTTTSQREILTAEMAYQIGKERGNELATLGINMNFAPVLEKATTPSSFLYERVFADTEHSATLAGALIQGMATAGVTGVVKHFPGHPDTATDSHQELPQVPITRGELDLFTAPFAELIKNNPPIALMTAHVQFPEIDSAPATLSSFFLSTYLRGTLGYNGLIITDDMIMRAVTSEITSDVATLKALSAGADVILFAAEPEKVTIAISSIIAAVESGTLPLERIDDSYRRIKKFKSTLGTTTVTVLD